MGDEESVLDEIGKAAAVVGAKASALADVHEDLTKLRLSIEKLAVAIGNLASKDEVEARLVAQSRELTSKRRRTTFAFAVAGLGVLVALLALFVVARQNGENGDILISCTTPGPPGHPHPCFDRGERVRGQAVAQIVDGNGNGIPDIEEVREELARLRSELGIPTPTTLPSG